jgi:hypothetical protein
MIVHDQCVPVLLVNCIVRADRCWTEIAGVAGVAVAVQARTRLAASEPITAAHLVLIMQTSLGLDRDVLSLQQQNGWEWATFTRARLRAVPFGPCRGEVCDLTRS